MTEREALMYAILDQPAEDTPRLVFADWLDEHDEHERAEFIRVQVELSRVHSWLSDPRTEGDAWQDIKDGKRRRDYLRGRLNALPAAHGFCHWPDPECPPLLVAWDKAATVTFTRGFVSHIELPAAAFRPHAEAIFRAQPVTSVRLTDKEPLNDAGVASYFNEPPNPPQNWFWINGGEQPDMGWQLPPELYLATCPNFTSETAAYAWLSARCVSYGRKLAGLSPLPELEAACLSPST